MAQEERLQNYVVQKLSELDGKKDLQEIIYKDMLSFGIESKTYSHLPAWQDLLTKKKKLGKRIWVSAFFLSFAIVCIVSDAFALFEYNWIKALLKLVLLSGVVMVFYVIGTFYSLFYHFRQAEREVRKLIYQDILFQLKKEESVQ